MESPMGLSCPDCGRTTHQKIIESRPRLNKGSVFRRRECACGCRFSTCEEIVVEEKVLRATDGVKRRNERLLRNPAGQA